MMVRGDSGRKVFSKEREIITETRHLSEMMLLIQIRQSRRDGEEEDGEDEDEIEEEYGIEKENKIGDMGMRKKRRKKKRRWRRRRWRKTGNE